MRLPNSKPTPDSAVSRLGIIKAAGRTCVIAASVEAKKYGIKTGTDIFEARKLCPQIILVVSDLDKYADITYRFINICSSYSPTCEVFSLDECFIDVTETEKFFGGVLSVAYEIKRRLREEIGDYLTCSVGISHNRLLAKLASSQIKPDGLFLITEANVLEVLDKSDFMDVCGIGFALNNHLRLLGIDNFPKLRDCSLEFLHKHFGPFWSVHLYNICRGVDQTPVVPICDIPDAKSVGRTYTTHQNLYKKDEILKLMRNLCEETAYKARQMRLAGRYVGLTLRGPSFVKTSEGKEEESYYGHRTLKNYINDGKRLFDISLAISGDWSLPYVRFCGITLGMLTRGEFLPIPLFPWDRRRANLVSSVDRVNSRFGDYTVFPAQLLGIPIIRPEVNGYFGDKKFRLQNFLRHSELG